VLNLTGALDRLPSLSKEQRSYLDDLKDKALASADRFRRTVRRRLSRERIQSWLDKERSGAVGLAAGAVVGAVL
jgi:hypothetical protein